MCTTNQIGKNTMFTEYISVQSAKELVALSTFAGAAYFWMIIGTAFVGKKSKNAIE